MTQQNLDDLFAQARMAPVDPSDALMARVMADAVAHQPEPRGFGAAAPAAPVSRGFWSVLIGALGGGAGLAGLGTATLAGLWIGIVQPTSLTSLSDAYWQETPLDQVDLYPSFDAILTEG